jgi:hypothetical protein
MSEGDQDDQHGRIVVTGVRIDGLDAQCAEQFKQFTSFVVKTTAEWVQEFELPSDVHLRVIASQDFNAAVDSVSRELGNVASTPYEAVKHTVQAGGITIWSRDGRVPAEFAIILNPGTCGGHRGSDLVTRCYLLTHEFGHVIIEASRLHEEPPVLSATAQSQLEHCSRRMLDEIRADRYASLACRCLLRTDGGEPPSLCELLGAPLVETTAALLERLCRFSLEQVQVYRVFHTGFDELWPLGGSLVGEMAVVVAHLVAHYEADDRIPELTENVKSLRGFDAYLAEDWDELLKCLTAEGRELGTERLPQILLNILSRIGIEPEDLPDGRLYVHVHEPNFCLEEGEDAVEIA